MDISQSITSSRGTSLGVCPPPVCPNTPTPPHNISLSTMTLRFDIGSTVAPGDRLGSLRDVKPGIGTYSRGAHVFASAVGALELDAEGEVSVKPAKAFAASRVLNVGQIVVARVERVVLQQAVVDIIAAANIGVLPFTHSGAIKKEDVRSGASEEIQVQDAYRPGDIVLCRILSTGDTRRYLLTTAETELGVIRAISSTCKKAMVAISWKEMQGPDGQKESRKCAKPSNLQEMLKGGVSKS